MIVGRNFTIRLGLVPAGSVLGEKFSAGSGAVGVAGEGEYFGVMDESVDHRCSDDVVGERLAPSIWGWHLFVSVETRSSLGLQHVFAFQPSSRCERSILGAALTVQV